VEREELPRGEHHRLAPRMLEDDGDRVGRLPHEARDAHGPGRVRVRDRDIALLGDADEWRRVVSDEGSRRRGEVAPELKEHAAHEGEGDPSDR
jgi:hypothetical protein